jgi:hypothetical protein
MPSWNPDGRVVAVEVKSGATIRTEDLAGLRHLAQRLGPGRPEITVSINIF